jgi:hypothetical protein
MRYLNIPGLLMLLIPAVSTAMEPSTVDNQHTVSGQIVSVPQRHNCHVLVTAEGLRYRLVGVAQPATGQQMTVSGTIIPQDKLRCGVPLDIAVREVIYTR